MSEEVKPPTPPPPQAGGASSMAAKFAKRVAVCTVIAALAKQLYPVLLVHAVKFQYLFDVSYEKLFLSSRRLLPSPKKLWLRRVCTF